MEQEVKHSIPWMKKQAKKLLRAYRANEPQAVAEVTAAGYDDPTLMQVQHLIARNLGYKNWDEFREKNS
jgi:hypothetical protein